MRRLTVRLIINMFDIPVNELFGDTSSTPLKPPWNCIRYDVVPVMNDPSNRSLEPIYDEGRGQGSNQVSDLNYRRIRQLISESSTPGESPPPPPRAVFGRDELIEGIVRLADSLTPIALVGAGGIGKTSIALAVLHDSRIKQRFGEDRRFIRCDQFPDSNSHFLSRLSKVIGAGVENLEDLTPLRPLLSSKEMFIILDNAESILDPEGIDAQDIYATVEELSQFDNICLCITSRISTIPPDCEVLDIPTLSMEAARDAFYRIYKNSKRSNPVDNILEQLDFHPLSITLLATVAYHNKWDTSRLTKEWEGRRTGVLRTDHKKSFAAAIELSLTSPMFKELGPNARALLEVVAFFPQGIDEDKIDWLFPTISNRSDIFDKFRVLSLTYPRNGFVTMLAPLRDYLRPVDPHSSPLLCTTKNHYFSRLAANANTCPHQSNFEETRWITSEDMNIEHLLGVFASVGANSNDVWEACADFMRHLHWHKPRLVILGLMIEGLPDDHPSKLRCLAELSYLSHSVGHYEEGKRLLAYTLRLWRAQGNDHQITRTLGTLARTNGCLRLYEEAILRLKEAFTIYERLDDTVGQADSLQQLALMFIEVKQVGAAEEAASRAIHLSSGELDEPQHCEHHHILGHVCESRGETEAAIGQFKTALGIATSLRLQTKEVQILGCLLHLLLNEERFNDAQVYLEILKSYAHAANDPYGLDVMSVRQAYVWFGQGRFEEAKSELSCVIGAYEKMGVSPEFLEDPKVLLRVIEVGTSNQSRLRV